MTIALGFFYSEGVLVCADSQITAGYSKIDAQKTGRFSASWGSVIAAFEGNADNAAAAFHECDHLKETEEFRKDPVQAMRELLERRYKNNVLDHPDYASGNYCYSLLLGIFLSGMPDAKTRLYKTRECFLRPLTAFECMGVGEQFGRDTAKNLYTYKMGHKRAVFLAAYVLSHVSARSQYVGDKFVVQVLNHDGTFLDTSALERIAIHANNVGNWFVQECQRFLVLHAGGDIANFSRLLMILDSRATHIRALWDAIEAGESNPQSTKVDPSRLPPWPE
jgi:20S proteasome alpha/beta subunit